MILKFIMVLLMLTAQGKIFRHSMRRAIILRMSDDQLNWTSNTNLEWVWVLIFDKGSETEGVYLLNAEGSLATLRLLQR